MSRAQRVFWLGMAFLFFVTTVGFTGFIIWQIRQDNKRSQQTADIQKALQEAQAQQELEQQVNQPEEGKLQGTKLAGFTPSTEAVNSLQKIDTQPGNGETVPNDPNVSVTVHYTGALVSDGTIFDTSIDRGEPSTFALNQVIAGWTQGIPGMQVGGKRRLIIPAELAYGSTERPGIPANSDLVFDVELIKIGD